MNEEYSLCKICDYVLSCERAEEQNKKIYFCEDFKKTSNIPSTKTVNNNSNDTVKHNMEHGLCKICENRNICGIQVPNGGLWRCENFL
jgi:hypothetical protein